MSVKYELSFKVKGGKWKVFDTYSCLSDPDIKKYYKLLSGMKYNGGVRVVKIETKRDIINFEV